MLRKSLKQCKIFEISLSESQVYKKWQTFVIIQEISDSNLETGRYGSKSGVSRVIPGELIALRTQINDHPDKTSCVREFI